MDLFRLSVVKERRAKMFVLRFAYEEWKRWIVCEWSIVKSLSTS